MGSGESIRVWLDSWLPSCEHPRILSPLVDSFELAREEDLIDSVSKQWRSSLLQGLFNPHEVDLIKSIPLCRSYSYDRLIWPYTSSGQYKMQSGYGFLANENTNNSITEV